LQVGNQRIGLGIGIARGRQLTQCFRNIVNGVGFDESEAIVVKKAGFHIYSWFSSSGLFVSLRQKPKCSCSGRSEKLNSTHRSSVSNERHAQPGMTNTSSLQAVNS